MNGLNGLDFVGVALLAIGAIYGLQRGALRMVTSVVALAAAIYFASIYYNKAGAFAETELGSSHTVGAVVVMRKVAVTGVRPLSGWTVEGVKAQVSVAIIPLQENFTTPV